MLGICALAFSLSAPGLAWAAGIYSVQVGSFIISKNAEKVVGVLGKRGIECTIVEEDGFSKVRCGRFKSKDETRPLWDRLRNSGYKDAFIVMSHDAGDEAPRAKAERPEAAAHPAIPAVPDAQAQRRPSEDGDTRKTKASPSVPLPGSGKISGDILKRRGGHFHPFLSVTEVHTDNLFNTAYNRVSDYETALSTGLWLAVPANKQEVEWASMSVLTPGGRPHNRIMRFNRLMQIILLYRLEFERFRDNPDADFDHQTAGGQLQLRSRGGFHLSLSEQFLVNHDDRGIGIPGVVDKFDNNSGDVTMLYDFGKLTLRADYTNFYVDYKAPASDFKDREDNVYSGYVYYNFSPKTSVFGQYEYIDIDYDDKVFSDSRECNYFGGIEWDVTAKSTGVIKAGYGIREFADTTGEESKEFVFAGILKQQFTPKTSLSLAWSGKREESDVQSAGFVFSNRISADYSQRFTHKITGRLGALYVERTYEEDFTFGGVTKQRRDELYRGLVALKYEITRWLSADIGYERTERKSSFSLFDYTTNRAFFRITASL